MPLLNSESRCNMIHGKESETEVEEIKDTYVYSTQNDRNFKNVLESDHRYNTGERLPRGFAFFALSEEEKKKVWGESMVWAKHCADKGLL